MSNNTKKKEKTQNIFKDSFNTPKQNKLYKSFNDKKRNKIHLNNNIDTQELTDIKLIVKNSVEKIYDLFNLQEMKSNSRIISRKSHEINSVKDKTIKYNEDNYSSKSDNFMKTNITFKINNYLSVLNKNKNGENEINNGTTNTVEDENSYFHKKYKKNEMQENSTNNIKNAYNLKKNKKKELKKNYTSNTNYIINKNDIKKNILISSKNKKRKNNKNIDKEKNCSYLFLSPQKKSEINNEDKRFNNINEDKKSKNEESNNNNISDKSIIVNTKIKKNDMNKSNNNYIIKPTRISHINKESEATITNDIIDKSKEIKNIFDSRNLSNNSSEKRKKYMFLKRTKTKNNTDIEEQNMKKKLIFSQQKSKTKSQLSNSKTKNLNLYSTREEFYLRKQNKLNDKEDILYSKDFENNYKKFEINKKNKKDKKT